MKTAILVEDGLFQVVLTPQSDLEKMALEKLSSLKGLEVYKGSFYECRGGWQREGLDDSSTIFICRDKQPAPSEVPG